MEPQIFLKDHLNHQLEHQIGNQEIMQQIGLLKKEEKQIKQNNKRKKN